MDEAIGREMLSYYDERAGEYDQLYAGQEPAIQDRTAEYVEDVVKIGELAASFGAGHLIDVACGTGFWASYYAQGCDEITFLDQSPAMLTECQRRTEKAGLSMETTFVQGNVFEIELKPALYDRGFVGFLLSHLTQDEETKLLKKLQCSLRPTAKLMIVDSYWNERRREQRQKEGVQKRVLTDGRIFRIYKKYFDRRDVEGMCERAQLKIESLYVGQVFIAIIVEYGK